MRTQKTVELFFFPPESLILDYLHPKDLAILSSVSRAARQGIQEFCGLFSPEKFPILSQHIEILSPVSVENSTISDIYGSMEIIQAKCHVISRAHKVLSGKNQNFSSPSSLYDYQSWEEAIQNLKLEVIRYYPTQHHPLLAKTLGSRLIQAPSENASLPDLETALFALYYALESNRLVFSDFVANRPSYSLPTQLSDFSRWESVLERIYLASMREKGSPNPNENWVAHVEREDQVHLFALLSHHFEDISAENLNRACASLLIREKVEIVRAIFFSDRGNEISDETINFLFARLPQEINGSKLKDLEELIRSVFFHRMDSISTNSLNTFFLWLTNRGLSDLMTIVLKSPKGRELYYSTLYYSIGLAAINRSQPCLNAMLEEDRFDLMSADSLNDLILSESNYLQFVIIAGACAAGQLHSIREEIISSFSLETSRYSRWDELPQTIRIDLLEKSLLIAAEKDNLPLFKALESSNQLGNISVEAAQTALELAENANAFNMVRAILDSVLSDQIESDFINEIFIRAVRNEHHFFIQHLSESKRYKEINEASLTQAFQALRTPNAEFRSTLLHILISRYIRSLTDPQLDFIFQSAIMERELMGALHLKDNDLEGRLPSSKILKPNSKLLLEALQIAANNNVPNTFKYVNQWLGENPIPGPILQAVFFDACHKGKAEIFINLTLTERVAGLTPSELERAFVISLQNWPASKQIASILQKGMASHFQLNTLSNAFAFFCQQNEPDLATQTLVSIKDRERIDFFDRLAPRHLLDNERELAELRRPILALIQSIPDKSLKEALEEALFRSDFCPAGKRLKQLFNPSRKRDDKEDRPPNSRISKRHKEED